MDPVNFIQKYCAEGGSLQGCLQGAYNMGIAIAIAIAFLYVVIGALQYLTGAAINKKEQGKNKITGAIKGLIVIFVSGVVLYWINPNIFNAELIIYKVTKLEPPKFSQFEQIYGQHIPQDTKNALINLSFAPGTPTGEVIAKIAETIATNDTGYYRTIMSRVGTGSDITSCAIFVNTVLRYANEKLNGKLLGPKSQMLRGNGGQFAGMLNNQFNWNAFQTGKYPPQRGDVIVWETGGYGHVAILLSKNPNGTFKIAESSSTSNGIGFPPKISTRSASNLTQSKTARPR